MTPSQRARQRKFAPKRTPGDVYETRSYYHAIRNGCRKARVPNWHPNQLRHNSATRLRREFGLDVARVILGHSSTAVTEVYAEVDREKALSVMELAG
jgi:integrase